MSDENKHTSDDDGKVGKKMEIEQIVEKMEIEHSEFKLRFYESDS